MSKARGRAGRESERPRREAAPSAPKQQSHVQDLLGGFDGEPGTLRNPFEEPFKSSFLAVVPEPECYYCMIGSLLFDER